MAYRSYRSTKPTPRPITVKYAGKCICCAAPIAAGESAMYYPAGTIYGISEGKIGHFGGLEGKSAVCAAKIRAGDDDAAVAAYVAEGLGER